MSTRNTTFLAISSAFHLLGAAALVLLFFKTGGMTVFCVVAGALIACASVAACPNRPVTIYIAFGLLMGYAFWMGASAINQGALLELLLVLLLASAAVWLLQAPGWLPALFAGILLVLFAGLALWQHARREMSDYDPDFVRRSALTSFVILSLGLVYVCLGLAEASLHAPEKRAREKRRSTRRKRLPRPAAEN